MYDSSHTKTFLSAPHIAEYACLLIGDELLDGHVNDTNLSLLIKKMLSIGYSLKEVRIVSDEPKDISAHLTQLRDAFVFVVTIGGLGPTHDDRTLQGYSMSFKQDIIEHKGMMAFFMCRPVNTEKKRSAIKKMSTIPKGIELISLNNTWPLLKLENCFAMPGLPSVCRITIDKLMQVLPVQNKKLYGVCYTTLSESDFATWLTGLSEKYKEVHIGSYPLDTHEDVNNDEIKSTTKISLTAINTEKIYTCFNELKAYLQNKKALVKEVLPH